MDEGELERLRQAAQAAPDDVDAQLALLQGWVSVANWQEAAAIGDTLVALTAETPVADLPPLLSVIYGHCERWDEAIAQCQRALDEQPDDAVMLFNLGTLQAQLGEDKRALETLEKAKLQQEEWAELNYNLGLVLLRLERYGDALDAFESATEQREGYAEAHFSRGNVHALRGLPSDGNLDYYEIDCAITAYKAAIQHRPNYTAALYNLGMLYGRMGSSEGTRVWNQYLEATAEVEAEETWRMRAREYKRDLEDRLS